MFRSPTKKDFQYIAEFLFRQVWAFYVFVINIFFSLFFLHIFLHTIYNTALVNMAPVRWTPTLRLERKPQTKNLSLFLNRFCLFTAVLMPKLFHMIFKVYRCILFHSWYVSVRIPLRHFQKCARSCRQSAHLAQSVGTFATRKCSKVTAIFVMRTKARVLPPVLLLLQRIPHSQRISLVLCAFRAVSSLELYPPLDP